MEFAGSPFKIKQLSESGAIEGLLAGFDNVDSHGDVLSRKAFSRTLAERAGRPLPMLLHHDMHRPIGAWKSWEERAEGLFVKGDLTLSTRDAQEAHALAKAGALTGLSIGFRYREATVDQASGQKHVSDVDLIEGSLVTVPSNPITHVSTVKSISGPGDITQLLREGGVSGRKAKAAGCAAWRAIHDSEDEAEAEAEAKAILDAAAKRIAAIGGATAPAANTFDWS